MILCSACLLGIKCRYDGKSKPNEDVIAFAEKHNVLPICPEQLGGLPTPREKTEIKNGKAVTESGKDVTLYFQKGANEVLKKACVSGADKALLKARSGSCGYGQIYDGTFKGRLVEGNGICASMLSRNGIKVFTEENFKKTLLATLLVICTVCWGSNVFADKIVLKNKRKVSGQIIKENKDSIEIDLGYGTVELKKDQIKTIERTGETNLANNNSPNIKTFNSFQALLRDIYNLRNDSILLYDNRKSMESRINEQHSILYSLYDEYERFNNALSQVRPRDVSSNNRLIAKLNVIRTRMEKADRLLRQYENKKRGLDLEQTATVLAYSDKVSELSSEVYAFRSRVDNTELSRSDSSFVNDIISQLGKFKNDIKHTEIDYLQEGSSIFIMAEVNNSASANLAVDTGASLVFLSQRFARKAGLSGLDTARRINCVLADGSKAEAIPVILDSLKVGDMVANNVKAAVIETEPAVGVDGLLGMSFLDNFVMKIDTKGKKLRLEEFKTE